MKHTPLYELHAEAGAHFGAFGGFEMPLWYAAGLIAEHRCVLTGAGLFDTSHMSFVEVSGPGARALLQYALTRDLESARPKRQPLIPGTAAYGFFLDPSGHLIDDAIIFQLADEAYLVIVNAGMGTRIQEHLGSLSETQEVQIFDQTGTIGKLDIQGPASYEILRRLVPMLPNLKPFAFAGSYAAESALQTVAGTPLLVSRTGYTGELGAELLCPMDAIPALWQALMEAGAGSGLLPCGLGARDSLRAGAGLPLSHQDIGDWPCTRHPWEFALSDKNFLGRSALDQADGPYTYAFVGRSNRKVPIGADVSLDGVPIGEVLTCVTDMGVGLIDGLIQRFGSASAPADFNPRGLACGFVRVQKPLCTDDELVLSSGRKQIPATIVSEVRPGRTFRQRL